MRNGCFVERVLMLCAAMTAALTVAVCQDATPARAADKSASASGKLVRDPAVFTWARKKIASKWQSKTSASSRAVLSFKVNDTKPNGVYVCNTSGSEKFDADAKAALLAALPLKVTGFKDGTELRARFDPFVHSVDIYEPEDVDFGPYMAMMQKAVKRQWFPPKGNESKRVVAFWKVKNDGTIYGVRIDKSSGVPAADQAALNAVRKVGKLRPLPAGAPDSVDIQFTFDYNVKGGGSGNHKHDSKSASNSHSHSPGPGETLFNHIDQFLKPK